MEWTGYGEDRSVRDVMDINGERKVGRRKEENREGSKLRRRNREREGRTVRRK